MDWLFEFKPIDYDPTYVELDPRFSQKYLQMAKVCSDMHFLYNHTYLLNMFDDGVSPVPYLVARWFELEFDPIPRIYNFPPFVKRSTSTDKSPKISEALLLDYISNKTKKGETWNKRSTIGYTEGELVQFRDCLEPPKENVRQETINQVNRLVDEMNFVQTEIEELKKENVNNNELIPCGDYLDTNYVDCFESDDIFGIRADKARDLIVQKTIEMRGLEKRIEHVFNNVPSQVVRFYDSSLGLSARVYREDGENAAKELLFESETVKFDVLSTKTISGRQLVFINDYVPEYEKNKNGYMVDINSGFCNDWINYFHLGDRKMAMDCMDIIQGILLNHSEVRATCRALSFACLQLMLRIDVDSLKPYFYKLPELRVQDAQIYMVKNEKINHRMGNNVLGAHFFKKEYGIMFENESKVLDFKNCLTVEHVENRVKTNYFLKWRNLKTANKNFNYLRVYIANQKKEVGMNVRKSNVVMYVIFHDNFCRYQKINGKFLFCDKKIYDFDRDLLGNVAFCMNQEGDIRYLK